MADDLQRVSGLWLRAGKRGYYMTGKTEEAIPAGAKLLIFKNNNKETGSDQPDYSLHCVMPENQPPMQRAEPGRQPERATAPPVDDSEIPF